MGVQLSRMCMEAMVEHGAQALKDNEQGVASYALEQVALDIIITAGWVSLLVAREHTMDYNGGVAHAFFYGLCNLPGFDEDRLMEKRKNARSLSHLIRQWAFQQSFLKWV